MRVEVEKEIERLGGIPEGMEAGEAALWALQVDVLLRYREHGNYGRAASDAGVPWSYVQRWELENTLDYATRKSEVESALGWDVSGEIYRRFVLKQENVSPSLIMGMLKAFLPDKYVVQQTADTDEKVAAMMDEIRRLSAAYDELVKKGVVLPEDLNAAPEDGGEIAADDDSVLSMDELRAKYGQ